VAGNKSVGAKDAENGKKGRKGNQDHTMNRKPGGGEFRNWASPIFSTFLCVLCGKWIGFSLRTFATFALNALVAGHRPAVLFAACSTGHEVSSTDRNNTWERACNA